MDGRLKILVVEDDEVDLKSVRRALTRSDLDVEMHDAGDVASALQRMVTISYDCAVVDHQLPDGTAWDILDARDIKDQVSSGPSAEPPIVILTGHGSENIAVEFMRTGVCDYVPKSDLTPARIGLAVRNAVRLSRLHKEAVQASEDLKTTESCSRYLFQQFADPLLLVDAQGRIIDANAAFLEEIGISREGALETSFLDHVRPAFAGMIEAGLRSGGAKEAGVSQEGVAILRRSDTPFGITIKMATCEGCSASLVHLRQVGREPLRSSSLRAPQS
jgi:DNA-binding response OmpR family regulator